jgi:hypothetical protein
MLMVGLIAGGLSLGLLGTGSHAEACGPGKVRVYDSIEQMWICADKEHADCKIRRTCVRQSNGKCLRWHWSRVCYYK